MRDRFSVSLLCGVTSRDSLFIRVLLVLLAASGQTHCAATSLIQSCLACLISIEYTGSVTAMNFKKTLIHALACGRAWISVFLKLYRIWLNNATRLYFWFPLLDPIINNASMKLSKIYHLFGWSLILSIFRVKVIQFLWLNCFIFLLSFMAIISDKYWK